MYIKSKKGITLIALIITVIIMLILAGVAIWQASKPDGLLSKVFDTTQKYTEKQAMQELQVDLTEWELEKRTNENANFKEFLEGKEYKVMEYDHDYVVEKYGYANMIKKEDMSVESTTLLDYRIYDIDGNYLNDMEKYYQLLIAVIPINLDEVNNVDEITLKDSSGNILEQCYDQDSASFIITENGKYTLVIKTTKDGVQSEKTVEINIDKIREPNTPTLWSSTTTDKDWYSYIDITTGEEAKVNEPKLIGNMLPIVYTGGNISDSETKWANAMTEDGSMFVWIPRFAYKITYYTSPYLTTVKGTRTNEGYNQITNNSVVITYKPEDVTTFSELSTMHSIITNRVKSLYGTIDIVFLDGSTNNDFDGNDVTEQGYIVHPAFTSDAEQGGGFGEITGIWVAKFKTSYAEEIDYYSTMGVYNSTNDYTIQIKPVRTILNTLTAGQAYDLAKTAKYGEETTEEGFAKSHLIKNSEWGAVAYLSYSKYGRGDMYINGQKNSTTKLQSRYTGLVTYQSGRTISKTQLPSYLEMLYVDSNYSSDIFDTLKQYYLDVYENSVSTNNSNIGNAYGIYDMHGGGAIGTGSTYTGEMMASYLYNANVNANSIYLGNLFGETTEEQQTSTAYKTVYKSATTMGTQDNQTTNYIMIMKNKGDALYETSMQHRYYSVGKPM